MDNFYYLNIIKFQFVNNWEESQNQQNMLEGSIQIRTLLLMCWGSIILWWVRIHHYNWTQPLRSRHHSNPCGSLLPKRTFDGLQLMKNGKNLLTQLRGHYEDGQAGVADQRYFFLCVLLGPFGRFLRKPTETRSQKRWGIGSVEWPNQW